MRNDGRDKIIGVLFSHDIKNKSKPISLHVYNLYKSIKWRGNDKWL